MSKFSVGWWARRYPIAVAVLIVLVAALTGFKISHALDEKAKEKVQESAITLIFVGLLGSMLKITLDGVAVAGRKRDDAAAFLRAVLKDLKSVFDRVDRARILLAAYQSLERYRDEMHALLDSAVQLRNVRRALSGRVEGIGEKSKKIVYDAAGQMEEYVNSLLEEFAENYKSISDEHHDPAARSGNDAWKKLSQLFALKDFIAGNSKSKYRQQFELPLDKATRVLRAELSLNLERGGWSLPSLTSTTSAEESGDD